MAAGLTMNSTVTFHFALHGCEACWVIRTGAGFRSNDLQLLQPHDGTVLTADVDREASQIDI